VLPCKVEGARANLAGQEIALARHYPALAGKIELGIRPEYATLAPRGAGLPVRIARIDDIGRARIARVELDGLKLAASVPEGASFDGDQAALALQAGQIHIYSDGHLVKGEALPGGQP